jgi:acetamidase/formamidase
MESVSRNHIHTYWSNALPPAMTVAPGDTVVFETLDSSYGRVAREIGSLAQPGVDPSLLELIVGDSYESTVERRGHPLTGPVAVRGAEPGDTLAVEIVRVEPAAWGFTACRSGVLSEHLDERTLSYYHIWDLRDGREAELRPGVRVPLAPFCGVMGVAPAEPGEHSTIPPGRHGGNLDLRHLTAGAVLHLPVLVPGALLSVGDAHAAQGDGEVSGTGIEMAATVTLRLDLIKGTGLDHPRAVTSGEPLSIPGACHVSVGCEPHLLDAARTALLGTMTHLTTEHGLSEGEAYVLCSVCVDLKISQLVDLPNYTVSAYLPLNVFR